MILVIRLTNNNYHTSHIHTIRAGNKQLANFWLNSLHSHSLWLGPSVHHLQSGWVTSSILVIAHNYALGIFRNVRGPKSPAQHYYYSPINSQPYLHLCLIPNHTHTHTYTHTHTHTHTHTDAVLKLKIWSGPCISKLTWHLIKLIWHNVFDTTLEIHNYKIIILLILMTYKSESEWESASGLARTICQNKFEMAWQTAILAWQCQMSDH